MSFEIRCHDALAWLGQDDMALRMVEWFLARRAVPGWTVWCEVVHWGKAEVRFIGDMPHGWVGSDFVRNMWDLMREHGAQ